MNEKKKKIDDISDWKKEQQNEFSRAERRRSKTEEKNIVKVSINDVDGNIEQY